MFLLARMVEEVLDLLKSNTPSTILAKRNISKAGVTLDGWIGLSYSRTCSWEIIFVFPSLERTITRGLPFSKPNSIPFAINVDLTDHSALLLPDSKSIRKW